jgi:hypothetical protein
LQGVESSPPADVHGVLDGYRAGDLGHHRSSAIWLHMVVRQPEWAVRIETNTSGLEDQHAARYATLGKNFGRPHPKAIVWEESFYLSPGSAEMAQISGYIVVNVTGLASAGAVSAPGLKAGDRIIQASSPSLPGNVNVFEAVVSVGDEVQDLRRSDPRRRSCLKFWPCAFDPAETGAAASSGQHSAHQLS